MRISTTLEVLARATRGDRPKTIAKTMHLPAPAVEKTLTASGWPDLEAVATWQRNWSEEAHRDVWAVAETIEALANAARLNIGWVHDYTANLGREEMRAVIAIAVAMLPRGVDCEEALAWKGETRPGSEKPVRLPLASKPKILAHAQQGRDAEWIAHRLSLKLEGVQAILEQNAGEEAAA